MSTVMELSARHAAEHRDLAEAEREAAVELKDRLDSAREQLVAATKRRADLERQLWEARGAEQALAEEEEHLSGAYEDRIRESAEAIAIAEFFDERIAAIEATRAPLPPGAALAEAGRVGPSPEMTPPDPIPFKVTQAPPELTAEIVRRTGGHWIVEPADLRAIEDGRPLTTLEMRRDPDDVPPVGPRHQAPKGGWIKGLIHRDDEEDEPDVE